MMRRSIFSAATALLASLGSAIDLARSMPVVPLHRTADFSRPKTRRTGRKYPHSSTRQNSRIARQLAAGRLNFAP